MKQCKRSASGKGVLPAPSCDGMEKARRHGMCEGERREGDQTQSTIRIHSYHDGIINKSPLKAPALSTVGLGMKFLTHGLRGHIQEYVGDLVAEDNDPALKIHLCLYIKGMSRWESTPICNNHHHPSVFQAFSKHTWAQNKRQSGQPLVCSYLDGYNKTLRHIGEV